MAWIELHEAVREFWKIQRLADSMGVRYAEAEGWVCSLWLWCVSCAPKGDLSRFTPLEVAKGARCDIKPAELFAKMQQATLITPQKKVNDWQKYGLKKMEQNRRRQGNHRRKSVTLQQRDSNVQITPTNRTVPTIPTNHTVNVSGNGASRSPNGKDIDPVLIDEIVAYCDDEKSRGNYVSLIKNHGEGLVREAFGELKMRINEGEGIENRGAYVTALLKNWGTS